MPVIACLKINEIKIAPSPKSCGSNPFFIDHESHPAKSMRPTFSPARCIMPDQNTPAYLAKGLGFGDFYSGTVSLFLAFQTL